VGSLITPAKECCTFRCSRLTARDKRKVVWIVDGKPYCNVCFLDHMDRNELGRQRVVRLFDDESLYEDRRPKKRAKRNKMGAMNGNGLDTATASSILA
jgi:hypothetical protein